MNYDNIDRIDLINSIEELVAKNKGLKKELGSISSSFLNLKGALTRLRKEKEVATDLQLERMKTEFDYQDTAHNLKKHTRELSTAIDKAVEVSLRLSCPSILILLLVSFFSFSSFAYDCSSSYETPDFSQYPTHVCEYLTANYPAAKQIEQLYGVPVAITLGVASLESGYGRSKNVRTNQNHFNIRSLKRGERWARYNDKSESFQAFATLMHKPRYSSVLDSSRPVSIRAWCRHLQQRGYCSDKGYNKLLYRVIRYIDKHNKL